MPKGVSRRRFLAGIGSASVVATAGCTGLTGGGGSEWNRSIAAVVPQTGSLSIIGQPLLEGTQAAVQRINEESDGDDIEVEAYDTESNVEAGLAATRAAIDDGHPVTSGTPSSDVALAVRDLKEDEEHPNIVHYGNNPEITSDETSYSFRCIGDTGQTAIGAWEYLQQNDASNVAFVANDYSYPKTQAQAFRDYAPSGGEVVTEHLLPFGTENFQPVANDIADSEADALVFAYAGPNLTTLIQTLRETGVWEDKVRWADFAFGNPPTINALGQDARGVAFASCAFGTERAANITEFIRDEFDTRIAPGHLIAWDAAQIIAQGFETMDTITPQAVNEHLHEVRYDGAAGWGYNWGEHGFNDSYRLNLTEWMNQSGNFQMELVFQSDVIPSSQL